MLWGSLRCRSRRVSSSRAFRSPLCARSQAPCPPPGARCGSMSSTRCADDEGSPMTTLRQVAAISALNWRSIPQRLGPSLVVVIGIAGVVGVLVSVLTMAGSLTETVISTGDENRAIVLRNGSNYEMASLLDTAAVQTIMDAPGVARTADGDPAASADFIVPINLTRKEDGALAALVVRGVSPQSFEVRPEIRLVAGRMFMPGLREVVVGRNAQLQIAGVELGDRVALRDSEWAVVGVYQSGDAAESGMLTAVTTLLSNIQRTTG